jgi:hypothetical protein
MEQIGELLKDFGLPLLLGVLGYLGGRKSKAENFKLELDSLAEMRELIILDNKSLREEIKLREKERKADQTIIKQLRDNIAELKTEVQSLRDVMCLNVNDCKNKNNGKSN